MGTTIFLAELWGPVLLAIGVGFFVSREYYTQIYRDLEKNSFMLFIFGIFAMGASIAQILFHNTWDTLPEIVISILGWGTLIKGTLFVVFPSFVSQAGQWWVRHSAVWLAGVLMLLVGGYLTWFAYLV